MQLLEIKTDMADFEYKYSARDESERREIERIKNAYAPKDERQQKVEKLKRLNEKARRPAIITALTLGIAGTLIFGFGMCLCLVWDEFVWGICAGVLGILLLGITPPLHSRLLKRGAEKYGGEILKLSDELLKEE